VANWLCTREQVKRALGISGADRDALIGAKIAAASGVIEARFKQYFIPRTEVRLYDWRGRKQLLQLKAGFLAVTALTTDNGTVTIASDDYILYPLNSTQKWSIQIDQGDDVASTAEFGYDDSPQAAISVTGRVGWSEDAEDAGTVVSGLAAAATATTFVCSNGALIDVGHTLLVESEQVFVSERAFNDVGKNLNDTLTAEKSDVTITLEASHGVLAGETILIGSERMYVRDVRGNDLAVIRAYDGSTLAAHTSGADVYVSRTLAIVRGVNGTTAAVHADTTAVEKYAPPAEIVSLAQEEAIWQYQQDVHGQTGQVVSGAAVQDTNRTIPTSARAELWRTCERLFREPVFA
jgi:hypothetical protein